MTEQEAIESLQYNRDVLLDKYEIETTLAAACKIAIQWGKNEQKRLELIAKYKHFIEIGQETGYGKVMEYYAAVKALEECEVDDD